MPGEAHTASAQAGLEEIAVYRARGGWPQAVTLTSEGAAFFTSGIMVTLKRSTFPSIAVAASGFGPRDLIEDLNTMGLIFENLVVRDLRIYAESLVGTVCLYLDKSGLECDAVVCSVEAYAYRRSDGANAIPITDRPLNEVGCCKRESYFSELFLFVLDYFEAEEFNRHASLIVTVVGTFVAFAYPGFVVLLGVPFGDNEVALFAEDGAQKFKFLEAGGLVDGALSGREALLDFFFHSGRGTESGNIDEGHSPYLRAA